MHLSTQFPEGTALWQWLADARLNVHVHALAVMLLALWISSEQRWIRGAVASVLGIALALAALGQLHSTFSPWASYRFAKAQVQRDEGLLRSLLDELGRLETHVLTDIATLQAFAHLNHVYVHERLPEFMLHGENRLYPQNAPTLREMLTEEIDWVVLSARNDSDVTRLLEDLPPGVRIVRERRSEEHRAWSLERGAAPRQ